MLGATSAIGLTIAFGSRYVARAAGMIDSFVFILLASTMLMAISVGAGVYLALARHSNH